MRKVGEATVNDGKGLLDNEGLCDSLIIDCNNAVKNVCSGQYVQFCNTIVQMVQKLTNLKKGIATDLNDKEETIEELKRENVRLMNVLEKKGGDSNGEG